MSESIRLINTKEIKCIFKSKWYYKLDDVIKYFNIKKYGIKSNKLILNDDMPYDIFIRIISINYIKYEFIDNNSLIKIIILINDSKTNIYKNYLYKLFVERINEIINPELAIDRTKTIYYKKGIDIKYYFHKCEYIKNEDLINNKVFKNNEIYEEDLNIKIL